MLGQQQVVEQPDLVRVVVHEVVVRGAPRSSVPVPVHAAGVANLQVQIGISPVAGFIGVDHRDPAAQDLGSLLRVQLQPEEISVGSTEHRSRRGPDGYSGHYAAPSPRVPE